MNDNFSNTMVIFMIMSEVSDTVLDVRLEVLRRIKRAVVFAGVGHSSRVAQSLDLGFPGCCICSAKWAVRTCLFTPCSGTT